jgi:hypothetical protein
MNKKPDYVNEQGTKWWYESTYKEHQIWIVETTDGYKTRVALRKDGKGIIAEDQTIDGIGTKIDMHVFAMKENP